MSRTLGSVLNGLTGWTSRKPTAARRSGLARRPDAAAFVGSWRDACTEGDGLAGRTSPDAPAGSARPGSPGECSGIGTIVGASIPFCCIAWRIRSSFVGGIGLGVGGRCVVDEPRVVPTGSSPGANGERRCPAGAEDDEALPSTRSSATAPVRLGDADVAIPPGAVALPAQVLVRRRTINGSPRSLIRSAAARTGEIGRAL
jgi:hypothetical protein